MSADFAAHHNEVGVYAARVEDRNILTWIQKVTDTSPAVMIVGGNYHWSDCFWGRKDVEFVENGLFSKLTTVRRFEIFVSLRFYVKSILRILEVQKLPFLPYLSLRAAKSAIFHKNKNLDLYYDNMH